METALELRICRFPSGERLPVLLGADGFPVSLPTRYLLDCFQQAATNTKFANLGSVLDFYRWAKEQNPELEVESRLRSSRLLSAREVRSFADYLLAQRIPRLIAPWRRGAAPNEGLGTISNNTFNEYLGRTKRFVLWCAEFVALISRSSREYTGLAKRFDSQMLCWTRQRQRYGLTKEQQEELFRFIAPESTDNPFNAPVRFRNYVIVLTVFETGMRRGELCKIRMQDVHIRGASDPYIEVRRRPNDRLDPRLNEPQVKTRERLIPIRSNLADALVSYMQMQRGHWIRHPYRPDQPSDSELIKRIETEKSTDWIPGAPPTWVSLTKLYGLHKHAFAGRKAVVKAWQQKAKIAESELRSKIFETIDQDARTGTLSWNKLADAVGIERRCMQNLRKIRGVCPAFANGLPDTSAQIARARLSAPKSAGYSRFHVASFSFGRGGRRPITQ